MRLPQKIRNLFTLTLCLSASAWANDRHFGYTYETATMPKGNKELEVWSTARVGRDNFYSRLDHRMEFETGITDKLQTAFYLNWKQVTSEKVAGTLSTEYGWEGISSEWKYQFSNPSADIIGSALYAELGYNTDEIELEAKLLLDKNVGPFLLAANLISEWKYVATPSEMELEEFEPQFTLAAAYPFSPRFSLGLELRNHTEFVKESGSNEMELEHSALFLGPTVAYSQKSWWMTFTVLPQIPAFKSPKGILVLDEHEQLEARLLFSLHL